MELIDKQKRYYTAEKLAELQHDFQSVPVDGEGYTIPGEYDERFVRGTVLKLIADLHSTQEEIAKLKEEVKRLGTCPDCGGSGMNEMCHDPYYALPCACTVDWMTEAMKLAGERNALLEGLKWYADKQKYKLLNEREYAEGGFARYEVMDDRGERASSIIAELTQE